MQLPMASDIDLGTVANMTEGFSGADLQALLSDAQLAAVHDILDNVDASRPLKTPVITDALLKLTASKARPSVSEEEKRRLYSIYHQFLDSKRSVAAQVLALPLLFSISISVFLLSHIGWLCLHTHLIRGTATLYWVWGKMPLLNLQFTLLPFLLLSLFTTSSFDFLINGHNFVHITSRNVILPIIFQRASITIIALSLVKEKIFM